MISNFGIIGSFITIVAIAGIVFLIKYLINRNQGPKKNKISQP